MSPSLIPQNPPLVARQTLAQKVVSRIGSRSSRVFKKASEAVWRNLSRILSRGPLFTCAGNWAPGSG